VIVNKMDQTIWQKMQTIDTRILYVVLLLSISFPLLFPVSLPIIPAEQSREAFETVQAVGRLPVIKPALVDSQWSASTRGENEWQTRALIQHLMMRHIPFIVVPGDPQAPQLMGDIINDYKNKYDYVYGKDYIIVHYLQSSAYAQIIKGMARNIPDTLKTDENGINLRSFPIMRHVTNFSDISLLVEITPTASLDKWLQFLQGTQKVPIVVASTAVQSPEMFPYLDSHQINGLLAGVKGAGDYEELMGVKGGGTRVATALSLVYALIILLIILGNIGYLVEKQHGPSARRRA
jgi:hypothetical protein